MSSIMIPDVAKNANRDEFLDALQARNEARKDWVINPRSHWHAVLIAASMGAWGIVSGYAVFLMLWEETEKLHASDQPASTALWSFIVALLAASAVAFIAETMREVIRSGRAEPKEDNEQDSQSDEAEESRPGRLRTVFRHGPRIILTILMLALFELYVTAWHSAVELSRAHELEKIRTDVLFPLLSQNRDPLVDVIAIGFLWVLAGAFLSGVLAHFVIGRAGSRTRQVGAGAGVGILCGLIAAPLGVIGYILAARTVASFIYMVRKHQDWQRHVDTILDESKNPIVLITVGPLRLLDWLWARPYVGPVIVMAILSALVVRSWRKKSWTPLQFIGVGIMITVTAPLLDDLKDLLLLPLLAALIWAVPGAILGGSVPYLKRPSDEPRIWGIVSFATALFLMILTAFRLANGQFWIAVCLLFLAGVLLLRSRRVKDYWPLLGLCSAMLICGWTMVMQKATAFGVLEKVHAVNSLSPSIYKGPKIKVDIAKLIRDHPFVITGMGGLAEPGKEVKDLSQRVSNLSAESLEDQLKHTGELLHEAEDKKLELVDRVWHWNVWSEKPSFIPGVKIPDGETLLAKLDDRELSDDIHGLSLLPVPEQKEKSQKIDDYLSRRIAEESAKAAAVEAQKPSMPATSPTPFKFGFPIYTPRPKADSSPLKPDLGCVAGFSVTNLGQGSALSRTCLYKEVKARFGRRTDYLVSMIDKKEFPFVLSPLLPAKDLGAARQDEASFYSLNSITEQLEPREKALEEAVAKARDSAKKMSEWADRRYQQNLELALTGSFGFWVTVGLLAGWSVINHQKFTERSFGEDERQRCFWARGALLGYHDNEHGHRPADDHELFKQLSLELLTNNLYWSQRPIFNAIFDDFVPEKVAGLNIESLKELADKANSPAERRALHGNLPDGMKMVIENAGRLVAFYQEQSPTVPDSSGATLLRRLEESAKESPWKAIAQVRKMFLLRKSTPVGSFLQSVGLLAGGHYTGCEWKHSDDM